MLRRQAALRSLLRRRPPAALPAMLRLRTTWTLKSAADAATLQRNWARSAADLPEHELRRRRQVCRYLLA